MWPDVSANPSCGSSGLYKSRPFSPEVNYPWRVAHMHTPWLLATRIVSCVYPEALNPYEPMHGFEPFKPTSNQLHVAQPACVPRWLHVAWPFCFRKPTQDPSYGTWPSGCAGKAVGQICSATCFYGGVATIDCKGTTDGGGYWDNLYDHCAGGWGCLCCRSRLCVAMQAVQHHLAVHAACVKELVLCATSSSC